MWLPLITVTLLAAIAQGIAGFGFTLLAVSFYLLTLQSVEAVQLVIIVNAAISAVLVTRLWRTVPGRLWALLAAGGLLGFPAGLWAFARADLKVVELAIAGVTVVFAASVLWQESRAGTGRGGPSSQSYEPPPAAGAARWARTVEITSAGGAVVAHRAASALAVGVASGALASSLGAPGPPVALYLAGLQLDKNTFRALALSTFVVMQVGALLGQSWYIGVDARVWGSALVLAPVAAVGAAAGHRLSRHVSEEAFRRLVLLLLLATGAYMLYRATTG